MTSVAVLSKNKSLIVSYMERVKRQTCKALIVWVLINFDYCNN